MLYSATKLCDLKTTIYYYFTQFCDLTGVGLSCSYNQMALGPESSKSLTALGIKAVTAQPRFKRAEEWTLLSGGVAGTYREGRGGRQA